MGKNNNQNNEEVLENQTDLNKEKQKPIFLTRNGVKEDPQKTKEDLQKTKEEWDEQKVQRLKNSKEPSEIKIIKGGKLSEEKAKEEWEKHKVTRKNTTNVNPLLNTSFAEKWANGDLEKVTSDESKNKTNKNFLEAVTNNKTSEEVFNLLSQGANVDHQNDNGQTALMIAAENGYAELVTALLAGGAQTDLKDNNGKTALEIANSESKFQTTRLLLNKKNNANTDDNLKRKRGSDDDIGTSEKRFVKKETPDTNPAKGLGTQVLPTERQR